MKLVFSTRNVERARFIDLCRFADDYGYAGFEIYDALAEQKQHPDSIFRSGKTADGRRKLTNRDMSIAALTCPVALESEEATERLLCQYVEFARACGAEQVIFHMDTMVPGDKILPKMGNAIAAAEQGKIALLLETTGPLAHTEKVLELINYFASTAFGAAWNTRATYFDAGETAETTIKTLGAYIGYVRLGDRSGTTNCLLGEGNLPVDLFVKALQSLNYEGFVAADWNDEISDADIVLTHFSNFISSMDADKATTTALEYNRSHTGTFPWKKFDLMDLTFGQVLDVMAETYPDQYAFKYTTLDYTRTYRQFRHDVNRIARALIALGVKPGHHVAIWATNVPAWFLTFWATTKIGAVLVTVNTAYKISEIEYLLRQSDTHTLVMIEDCKGISYKDIMEELCPELKGKPKSRPLYSKNLPFLRNIVSVGFHMDGCYSWDELFDLADTVPQTEVNRMASLVKSGDVCNMQYTSGTTGFPKGVMLTHSNIINDGKTIGDRMDLSTADRMMIQVPMFHCFGMVLSMTSMMTHGGTLCPMPYFSPKSSLACINQEKITCFNGVPTMFIAMFHHEDFAKTDFSYMRTGIMAGSNCPPDLMRQAAREMNMTEIVSVYGQTESSPGCTMGEVNEDEDHRVETVGSAFPGMECKIIDPETGEDLPDGENGEFVVRGYNIMKGYYKMPTETANTVDADGWLHTGDLCCRTPDGYYKVTGRLKDMIIRGGENLYPREIEEFYLTNPKVKDCQVVGVKDEKYGEEACAWIIPMDGETLTEEEMRAYGMASMATHKVPRYFMFVKEFPMNAAGKILKYKMKETTEEKLGIQ